MQELLQLVDGAVAGTEGFEDPDADGMRERAEEVRFEGLQTLNARV